MDWPLDRSAWRRAAPFALMGVLGLLAVQAGRLGLADAYQQAARAEIAGRASRPAGELDVGAAAALAARSLRYAPRHPGALEDLGHLQLLQMHRATDPVAAVALAREASLNFRLALAQRPTVALNWARLALTKQYLAEQDEELLSALRLAAKLGPRDAGVPELVAHLGMALWSRSDPDLRREVVRGLGLSASRDAKTAFLIGQSYSRFDLMCDINALRSLAEDACERLPRAD